jgi:hypothetical protein
VKTGGDCREGLWEDSGKELVDGGMCWLVGCNAGKTGSWERVGRE